MGFWSKTWAWYVAQQSQILIILYFDPFWNTLRFSIDVRSIKGFVIWKIVIFSGNFRETWYKKLKIVIIIFVVL